MKAGALKLIRPDWTAPTNVKALVTTRIGGVSKTPFDSLNVGLHVNDKHDNVVTNRRILTQSARLPSEPIWLNQTHSSNIADLDSNHSNLPVNCDGAITGEKNIVCAVMTADCLPLFLSSKNGKQVGVLHVGWRGLANGIIEKGIALFDSAPEQILAWAGPCISQAHFEIGAQVKEQLGGDETAYKASSNQGKFYADMFKLTGQRLAELGVSDYSFGDYCTYADSELFYSYRRDQVTGRMVSLIWRE